MFKFSNPKKKFFQCNVRIAHLHPIKTAKKIFCFRDMTISISLKQDSSNKTSFEKFDKL